MAALGLSVGMAAVTLPGCSKGGVPEPDAMTCKKLADFDASGGDGQLPKALYAEMKSTSAGGASFGVMLEGSMGIYSGMRAFSKCDASDTYYLERAVLISAVGQPVAIAQRSPTGYAITYQSGQMATATGASFTSNTVTYSATGGMPSAKVQIVTLGGSSMVKLGDRITAQIAVGDEVCGIRESKWWLVPDGSPGSTPVGESVTLPGGSGNLALRVPTTISTGTYAIEGQVTLNNGGRVLGVRRQSSTDTRYKMYDPRGGTFVDSDVTVVKLIVGDNPEADRTPPVVVGMDATPASVSRCQQVNLSLRLADDRGLPSSQQVKLILGTADAPKLFSTVVSGGDLLTGAVVMPQDAPSGVWYAYPESVRDGAGNEAKGALAGGKVTLTGNGITGQPVMAATFILPSGNIVPDFGTPSLDGGTTMLPDLGMAGSQLPAALSAVSVTPSTATKEGDAITVTVTWTDLKQILK